MLPLHHRHEAAWQPVPPLPQVFTNSRVTLSPLGTRYLRRHRVTPNLAILPNLTGDFTCGEAGPLQERCLPHLAFLSALSDPSQAVS